jgi:hypothetical protein
MLKNMNAACIGNDKSVTFFWAEVQRENPYQFQTLNVLQNDEGLVVTREAFDVDGSSLYEPFTFSTKINDQIYNAWSTLKKNQLYLYQKIKEL